MSQIERQDVIGRLEAWLSGAIDAETIWTWALDAIESGTPRDEAVRDVMDVLAALPQDLVLKEDAQVMIEALRNPPEELVESQNLIWNYFDFVDTEGRKQSLKDDPFYGPYCAQVV